MAQDDAALADTSSPAGRWAAARKIAFFAALLAACIGAQPGRLTRNLRFPIGLHLGWNFTEGGIFGVSVCGGPAAKGILSVSLAGRTLLTGGKCGPEAWVVATVVCLALAIVLPALALRRGRWLPMPGHAAPPMARRGAAS